MNETKKKIAICICNAINNSMISTELIEDGLEVPKDNSNGDLAYPCFKLSKILRNSPVNIANDIKDKLVLINEIKKVEVVNGYLNFYLNNEILTDVLKAILKNDNECFLFNDGAGENIVIEYSSPNIAKPFHLGHFRNTVLGAALYRLYKNFGYNVIGLNYLGDWGRQFGLLIEGYELFKDEYDIEKNPLNALCDIYVRISKLAKEDETYMEKARQIFKSLENGNQEYYKLWEYFREISLKEYNRIYDILGCKFDSYNGEAFFSKRADEVIKILEEKNVLKDSQGAKVVNVGDDIPPCIILKSNGSTIYATRDLASILYRARNYDFKKAIYITGSEQILHFKQIFEVAKYLVDEKYSSGLVHIFYGMIRLKTGKMSTREGNVIYVNDLINEAISKAKKIIISKNPNISDLDEVAKKIGVGALIFNYLKTSKVKDIVFDLDETLRFDGETGPYVQYTYVRTKSILDKANVEFEIIKNANLELLNSKEEVMLIKEISKFESILRKSLEENEPSYIARYLIDVSTLFSRFYNECKILTEAEEIKNARLALTYATSIVIKKGLSILGIECPDRM